MLTNTSLYPYNDVVLIEGVSHLDTGHFGQGSGLVIGPHTILTASHVVYSAALGATYDQYYIYPGYSGTLPNPPGSNGAISSVTNTHSNVVGNANGTISVSDSQYDYAIIEVGFTFTSWFGHLTNYGGGTVHMTGYPGFANGAQDDQTGTVSADPNYNVFDYGTLAPAPGNSGGPLWISQNGMPDVVGIVSSSGYSVRLTDADWNVIRTWVAGDGYFLPFSNPPVVTAQNVTVAAGRPIYASTMIAAVSDADGDAVTQYRFFDASSGGGYLTVNGIVQAAGQWVTVTAANFYTVQYWGGLSAGSETLYVEANDGVYWSDSSSLTAATTGAVKVNHHAPDFNNDAHSDILWRTASGATGVSQSNGAGGYSWNSLGTIDPGWLIAGAGDFNGDHKADILWRNASGAAGLSDSNGAGGYNWLGLGTIDPGWQVVGTGDFNGDGKADILWRNTFGATGLSKSNTSGGFVWQDLGVTAANWQVASVDDFNNDGAADILWRDNSGQTGLANSNGAGGYAWLNIGWVDPNWVVAGTGDFNGDHRADILWRYTSGATGISDSNGSGGFTWLSLGVIPASWEVASVGDFNGDGAADILWQNASGATGIMNSKGAGGFGWTDLGTIAPVWSVQG